MSINKNKIEKYIEDHGIHSVEYGFGDINGTLRAKVVPVRHFLKNQEAHVEFARAPFAWDIQCGVYDDLEFANFNNGFPDLQAQPLLSTFREIPWRKGTAFILSEPIHRDHNYIELSPRRILQNVLEKAADLGYRLLTGAELEFYLFDENKKPVFGGVQCYSASKAADIEYFLADVRNKLESFDVKLEATHVEYGPAQIEIIPEYTDPLELADNSLYIKTAVKQIARQHHLYASFMPKIWENESGSGFHVHQSLWNKELTTNYFAKDAKIADAYLAGLVHFASDFFLLGSPSVNSYKRLKEYSFAPLVSSWGEDNRTVAVRSLFNLGDSTRIEYRTGSSDGNPYLIIAASIASGIYGIEHQLTTKTAVVTPLPRNLHDAVNHFEQNKQSKEFFGEKFVELFSLLGRHEAELFDQSITDWEFNRYFEEA